MELARHIAGGLNAHPEWIALAKANLERWSRQKHDAPGLLACYDQWRGLLARRAEDISAALLEQTDLGQRLRQNSPFAGVLSPSEVWQIKRRVHETSAA